MLGINSHRGLKSGRQHLPFKNENTCPQGRQVSKHGIPGFKFLNLRHKHPIGQITPSLPQPKDNIHFCERAHQANDSENKRSGGDSYSNQYGQYYHDQRPPSTL
jgi:hypothetical protein